MFDSFKESKKEEFSWKRATHVGVCRICAKGSEHCQEVPLDKRDLCEEHSFRRKLFRGLLLILLGLLLLVGLIGLTCGWFDKNAGEGPYSGKSQEEIVADLNAQVAEGEMNVSLANTIRFPNGSQNEGFARLENIAANHVDQKVTLYLADTNEVLYESGAIAPNHHIDYIRLNRYLEPGQYKAVAIFTGYERTDDQVKQFFDNLLGNHVKTGAVGAQINLLVE